MPHHDHPFNPDHPSAEIVLDGRPGKVISVKSGPMTSWEEMQKQYPHVVIDEETGKHIEIK